MLGARGATPALDGENAVTPKVYEKPLVTEDDVARRALGGVKGFPEGEPAPLTRREDEQTSPNDDPGHVA
jgi:hypothetical protein